MRIGILPTPNSEPVQFRLAALGIPRFTMDPEHLQELTGESTDVIYLLPTDAMLRPDWSQLRVRLARANRQFVMTGFNLTTAQIMAAVRGRELEAFDRSSDVHMGRIRAAIEADPKDPKRILTVRGVGYVFARQQE